MNADVPARPFDARALRWALVAVASVIFLCMAGAAWDTFLASEGVPAPKRVMDDTVKESLPIRLDGSRSMVQVGLLLAGGLWALYLGKTQETRVDLTETPELLLFLVCNACFLVSFASHYAYTGRLADWLNSGVEKGGKLLIPDIDEERLSKLLVFQLWYFRLGCLLSLFTFLS